MACLCKEIAGDDIELSPTCIGNLWIFEKLAPDDVQALAKKALRKKMKKGETVFMQGDSADEVFLIKGGRIKLTKILENGTQSPKGVVIQFPLTHEDLSFLTGAHRVSVTRAMKALKEAGKIILEGKQLILPALKIA